RLLHHKPARWAGGFPEQRPRSRMAMLECIIYELHSCPSQHIETAPVCEASQGITLWAGHVEVFAIIGHLRTERCYAWIERIGRRRRVRFFAVLGTRLIKSPLDAVKFAHAPDNALFLHDFSKLDDHESKPRAA